MSLTDVLGYCIYCVKVGNIKDMYSSFIQALLTERGTNIDQINVLFDGYTVKSTKSPKQKRRKKNRASVDWNLPIPQNMKKLLASNSNKQQLIDLFPQKLLIGRIQVK